MRQLIASLLTALVTVIVSLLLYDVASRHQFHAYWNRTPGALMLYGRPADIKYRMAFRSMSAQARAMGFAFTDPELVQTNELFNLWYVRWQSSSVIAVSEDGRYLLIDGPWMVQFADEDLECIFAHELGHVIDFQGLSAEHPMMQRLECLDSQQRADGLGRALCGAERYERTLRRYIKRRPIVLKECDA